MEEQVVVAILLLEHNQDLLMDLYLIREVPLVEVEVLI
jgi:hypothetical protein